MVFYKETMLSSQLVFRIFVSYGMFYLEEA